MINEPRTQGTDNKTLVLVGVMITEGMQMPSVKTPVCVLSGWLTVGNKPGIARDSI